MIMERSLVDSFKFKSVQANYLYKQLLQIAEDFKVSREIRDNELDKLDKVYAQSQSAIRYQDMVSNAFKEAMQVELIMIESCVSIFKTLNDSD
jgi:hypothetical protein